MDSLVKFDCEIIATALPPSEKLKNLVFINIYHVTEEFIEDPSGVRTLIGPYMDPPTAPIILDLQSSAPLDITQRLLDCLLDPPLCEQLASDISLRANQMGLGLQGFYMFVDMTLIKERVFLVSGSSPPRGASEAMLQRLVEEQGFDFAERLEKMNLESETCTICLENLLGSDTALVQMPNCSHVFHQECVVEWLRRTNFCPLCRSVPYEEDETE